MCAVDALAIPAMIGRDVTISSTDPLSGAHIDFYADEASANQALTSVNRIVITVPAALDLGNAVFAHLGTSDDHH
jgi:hypothetical protein